MPAITEEMNATQTGRMPGADGDNGGVMGTISSTMNDYSSKLNDVMSQGLDTLKDQYRVVSEKGIQGVKDDVTGYARREPGKALLLAGGIGALVALMIRRR